VAPKKHCAMPKTLWHKQDVFPSCHVALPWAFCCVRRNGLHGRRNPHPQRTHEGRVSLRVASFLCVWQPRSAIADGRGAFTSKCMYTANCLRSHAVVLAMVKTQWHGAASRVVFLFRKCAVTSFLVHMLSHSAFSSSGPLRTVGNCQYEDLYVNKRHLKHSSVTRIFSIILTLLSNEPR
jgi:hypothetical protein